MEYSSYIILQSKTIEDLQMKVNVALGEGYKLQGGVSHVVVENEDYSIEEYSQAMIKAVK